MLMTMMYFRDMQMIMSKRVVPMAMSMGSLGSHLFNFFMLVMICMRMVVILFHLIMNMMMSMAFREQQDDAEAHEQPGQRGLHCPVLAENGNRGHRAHEWSDGKNPGFARCPQEPKSMHIQDEADAMAQEPNRQRCDQDRRERYCLPKKERDDETAGTCAKRFHAHDCDWVVKRQALGQVVIDGPTQTGGGNGVGAERLRPKLIRLITQHTSTDHNQKNCSHLASAEILLEQADGKQDREQCLQVQQKRPHDCRNPLKSDEEENWTEDAAGHQNSEQETGVFAFHRCLVSESTCGPRTRHQSFEEQQTDSCSQIEQSGKRDRIAFQEKQFRERAAETK